MNNKFAVSTNTYHRFTLDEAINGISRAGFKYVELTGVKGWTEHVNSEMSNGEIKKVKDKLRAKGLKAIALSGHCNIISEDGLNDFLKNIELAHRLDCEFIVTGTGETHKDKEVVEDESKLIDKLTTIAKKCKNEGVKLVLETHGNNYNTGKSMNELIEKVGSDLIGINYDTANVIFYGKVKPETDIINGIKTLKYIHLKDKAGKDDEWNFPAVGKGKPF